MIHTEVKSLFKYRAFNEYSLQSLINDVAWFSNPVSFNDPFDCGIHIDDRRIEENIRHAVEEAYGREGKSIDHIPVSEFKVNEHDKQALEELRASVFEVAQSVGIFSLSSINNDILMWAHYADSHRGFCIEYSRMPNNILGKQAKPVVYQNELPSISARDTTSTGIGFESLLLTKSSHWCYEKEWRVINNEGNKEFQFPCEIKSIIFGLRMNAQNKYTIRRILRDRNVVFKEALKDKYKFSIRIEDERA